MFRQLIVEANLGASQQLRIPYQSTDLPLSKLVSIVKIYMQENNNDVEDLPQTPLFQEMLEASISIDKLLRMKKLRSEVQELQDLEEDNARPEDRMEEEILSSSESSIQSDAEEQDDL